jgi:uncharacterized protein (TIGR01777 family)
VKIILAGGSGQIGALLARTFHRDGHEVVVLSRRPGHGPWRTTAWDGATPGGWQREVDGCDAVINLAGRSVNCRYTAANRRDILHSRVLPTLLLGQAIAQAAHPPRVWLQSSTATIYAHTYDHAHDERDGVLGGDEPDLPDTWRFSIDVARAWERACTDAIVPHTRKVLLRTAMVMGPDRGGVFDTLLGLVRHGLGGRAGDGRQFMSWIHDEDFIASVQWLIARSDIAGAVNLASPGPLPNAEFMRHLREAAGASLGLPATTWMLEVGAALLRSESELVLKSRRVVPGRLHEHGFVFAHPSWPAAAVDLIQRWRAGDRSSRAA